MRQESLKAQKQYLELKFESFSGQADLFVYFIERGIKLLREGGIYSVIVSSSMLRAAYAESLREFITQSFSLTSVTDFGGLAVFSEAKDTYVCIPTIVKGTGTDMVAVSRVETLPPTTAKSFEIARAYSANISQFVRSSWSIDSPEQQKLFQRLMKLGTPLGTFVQRKFFRGILTGLNEAFVVAPAVAAELAEHRASGRFIHRFLGGEDIRHYYIEADNRSMIVVPSGWTRQSIGTEADLGDTDGWKHFGNVAPTIAKHLKPFEKALRPAKTKASSGGNCGHATTTLISAPPRSFSRTSAKVRAFTSTMKVSISPIPHIVSAQVIKGCLAFSIRVSFGS